MSKWSFCRNKKYTLIDDGEDAVSKKFNRRSLNAGPSSNVRLVGSTLPSSSTKNKNKSTVSLPLTLTPVPRRNKKITRSTSPIPIENEIPNASSNQPSRLSQSLIDLNDVPPPIPPRRPRVGIERHSEFHIFSPLPLNSSQFEMPAHLENPPLEVLPILQRNAQIRASRMLNPFYLIQFEGNENYRQDFRHLNNGERRSMFQFVTHSQPEHLDLPPSYDEALRLSKNNESSDSSFTTKEIKRKGRETSV